MGFPRNRARWLLVFVALWACIGAGPWAVPASASVSSAVLVVDTGSEVRRVVVSFGGDSISGLEALSLAGTNPETLGYGGSGSAVCRLFGVGHPASPQTCLGTPSDQRYWAYFRAPAGSSSFRYSGVGAGATRVGNGDVEGWRFGFGEAPPYSSFCDVAGCGGGSNVSSAAGSGGSSGASGSGGGDSGGGGSAGGATSSSGGGTGGGPSSGGGSGGAAGGGASDNSQTSGDSGSTGPAAATTGPGAPASAPGQVTDTRYVAGTRGEPNAHDTAQGPGWSEAGSRRRPFPYSLVALAVVLGGLGAGIIIARKKRLAIGR